MATVGAWVALNAGTISAVATVASTAYAADKASDVRKEKKKADQLMQQRVDAENQRKRRKMAAEQRRLLARARAAAIARGTSGGSAEQGTLSSIASQGNSAINFNSDMAGLDSMRFDALQRADKYEGRIETSQAVSGLMSRSNIETAGSFLDD